MKTDRNTLLTTLYSIWTIMSCRTLNCSVWPPPSTCWKPTAKVQGRATWVQWLSMRDAGVEACHLRAEYQQTEEGRRGRSRQP